MEHGRTWFDLKFNPQNDAQNKWKLTERKLNDWTILLRQL